MRLSGRFLIKFMWLRLALGCMEDGREFLVGAGAIPKLLYFEFSLLNPPFHFVGEILLVLFFEILLKLRDLFVGILVSGLGLNPDGLVELKGKLFPVGFDLLRIFHRYY